MIKEEPINQQDSELKKHEEKCSQRHSEILEKLASKLEKPTFHQLVVIFILLLGCMGGSMWTITSSISGLRERIAVVETGIENLKDNQMMLSGQIVQLDGKIDELIKHNTTQTNPPDKPYLPSNL